MPYDLVPTANVEGTKAVAFDREHPRYRCCCQIMHVTTGLKILAVLLVVSAVLQAINILMAVSYLPSSVIFAWFIRLTIDISVAVTVIEAIRKEKPGYLLPYLITRGIGIAELAVSLWILIRIAVSGKAGMMFLFVPWQIGYLNRGIMPALYFMPFGRWNGVAIWAVMLAIFGWLFWVVLKVYRFYRDQEEYEWEMPYDRVPMANVEGTKVVAFDREHPRYRCCCQSMYVTTGLEILAFLLVVSAFLEAFRRIGFLMAVSPVPPGFIFISFIQLAYIALIAVTVIEAIRKEKPGYLIPYLIAQGIGIAVMAVCLLILIGTAVFVKADTVMQYIESQGKYMDVGIEQTLKNILALGLWNGVAIWTVMLAIVVWLFWVVIKAYRFYRDQDEYKRRTSSDHYNAPAMGMA